MSHTVVAPHPGKDPGIESHISHQKESVVDPLDISQYRLDRLPKKKPTRAGLMMQSYGLPVAIISFIILGWLIDIPLLDAKAQLMLAVFTASIILWITEAVPNYLTSMSLTVAIVLLEIVPKKTAMATLGHPIIWLNVAAFILASALVKTRLAERIVVKFGKNAGSIFGAFSGWQIISEPPAGFSDTDIQGRYSHKPCRQYV